MRVRISGASVGPVHPTLWSSRGGNSGCGFLLGLLVVLVALGALAEYWKVVVPVAGILMVASVIGLRMYGKHGPSRKAGQRFGAAGPKDAAIVAALNTRPAYVPAALRERNRTGDRASIPGWHWTDGDPLERDAEPQAKHSDRQQRGKPCFTMRTFSPPDLLAATPYPNPTSRARKEEPAVPKLRKGRERCTATRRDGQPARRRRCRTCLSADTTAAQRKPRRSSPTS
jgi:hypothetical protein